MTPDETITELRAENSRLSRLNAHFENYATTTHTLLIETVRLLHQCRMHRLGAEEGCDDWHAALDIVKAERAKLRDTLGIISINSSDQWARDRAMATLAEVCA